MANPNFLKTIGKSKQRIQITAEQISKLAYEIYEKRGRQEGGELDDWLEAERILKAQK